MADFSDFYPAESGVEEAPVDGTPYVRQDAGWVAAPNGAFLPLAGGNMTGDIVTSNGHSLNTIAQNQASGNMGENGGTGLSNWLTPININTILQGIGADGINFPEQTEYSPILNMARNGGSSQSRLSIDVTTGILHTAASNDGGVVWEQQTCATTGQLDDYLPLAGGTLTGPLNATRDIVISPDYYCRNTENTVLIGYQTSTSRILISTAGTIVNVRETIECDGDVIAFSGQANEVRMSQNLYLVKPEVDSQAELDALMPTSINETWAAHATINATVPATRGWVEARYFTTSGGIYGQQTCYGQAGGNYYRDLSNGVWSVWRTFATTEDLGAYLPLAGGVCTGLVEAAGFLVTDGRFRSRAANLILSFLGASTGNIILRPNGEDNAVGEAILSTTGSLELKADIVTAPKHAATKRYVDSKVGTKPKAGKETGIGGPSTRAVTFATPFGNANYSIALGTLNSDETLMPTYTAKTAAGFSIRNNASKTITVDWIATPFSNP